MSNINDIQNSVLAKLGIDKEKSTANKELGQEQFLELLVAQMSHQNPLEPQTNGEFITQLAQFGTVNGVQEMNKSFESLQNALQSNQALQATALVGRDVLIASNKGYLAETGNLDGSADIPFGTQSVFASVFNSQGELVKQISLGNPASGELDFSWDGVQADGQRAPAGQYEVRVEGLVGGDVQQLSTSLFAHVDSVTMGANGSTQGLQLNLNGLSGVGIDTVKQIK